MAILAIGTTIIFLSTLFIKNVTTTNVLKILIFEIAIT